MSIKAGGAQGKPALRGEFSRQSDRGAGWPEGYRHLVLERVGSTFEAARRADLPAPFWLMAHQQSAARGRHGRRWSMSEGNFAATLVLRLSDPPARQALRSFAMAVAVLETLEDLTGDAGLLALKWPNDVLMNGGKVAGILLEADGAGHLAIGVGVNLADAPAAADVEPGALRPVAVATETGFRITPEDFLPSLAGRFADVEARFVASGFGPVRSAWLARAARLGEVISARLSDKVLQGRFDGIDADGQLVLQTANGVRTVSAADIYF